MKILMVSDVLTHPTQMGNRQRIYRECVQMRRLGWEVDFLYFGNSLGSDMDMTRSFFGVNHFLQCFKGNYTIKSQAKKRMRDYMDQKGITKYFPLKYNADEWYTDEIENIVKDLLKKTKYDAIWIQYFFQSKVLECLKDFQILKVIDTHDKWANRNRIYQRIGKVPEYFYTTIKEEKRALQRADTVIAIQKKEERYFQELLKDTPVRVLTIGDLVENKHADIGRDFSYGFIGANNRPNVLGLEWFCKKVLPFVQNKCPNSKFVVAGGICDCIPDYPRVYKMGRVEKLEDFYNEVQVIINPVQNGTGLNIKTIEALSYGKPLVTTSIGAKGIDSVKSILVKCDKPQVFADEIMHLFTDKKLCGELIQNAQEYIRDYNEKNVEALSCIEKYAMNR